MVNEFHAFVPSASLLNKKRSTGCKAEKPREKKLPRFSMDLVTGRNVRAAKEEKGKEKPTGQRRLASAVRVHLGSFHLSPV
jgi:hypothetical protein